MLLWRNAVPSCGSNACCLRGGATRPELSHRRRLGRERDKRPRRDLGFSDPAAALTAGYQLLIDAADIIYLERPGVGAIGHRLRQGFPRRSMPARPMSSPAANAALP